MKNNKAKFSLLIVLTIGLIFLNCGSDDETMTGNEDVDTSGLFEGIPAPASAQFTGQANCRESGVKRDYERSGGSALTIASDFKAVLDADGWNTFNLGGIDLGAGFQATKGGRYLNFQNGGPPGGARFINICVWPSQPNDDNCDQNCND